MGIAEKIIENQDREGMLRRSLERIIQLYTDKSHFVYELLQNAEDAGAKNIKFIQYADRLEVFHDGRPFTQANLQSLCDIGKSDKTEDLNQIGEFGVGFKSVFGICDTVKLYSSPKNYQGKMDAVCESFAIEIQNFTLPVNIEYTPVESAYTTRFIFPYHLGFTFSGFKTVDDLNKAISSRLRNLGITTLLFMRHLESIEYEIRSEEKVSTGVYLLQKDRINDHCSLISALGETGNKEETLSYLKFSKSIDDTVANRTVDIAFPVTVEKDGTYVFKEAESPFISVYFPTETESKLKFIVQGPYRTTPNRSSVPSDEPENIQLSKITAELLKESIRELRDRNLINLSFLQILPIDEDAFRAYDLFKPLYSTVRILLSGDNMLPCRSGGYVPANRARIARNQNLPDIFDDALYTSLVNKPYEYKWLSTELTETSKQYKELYEYLTDVLDVTVVRPEDLRNLFNENPAFLQARDDEWLIRMYGMYESIPNVFSKSRYGTNMLTACFIKTDKGEFVAPFRKDADGNYLQNVFLPSQKAYSNLDIAFLDGHIYSQCQHFFKEILGLQAPKEYDLFIKDYKSRTATDSAISDADHIADIKNLLHYLNSSDYGSDVAGVIRESLKLVCRLKGNTAYINPYKTKVLFPKTESNISIEAYYKGIADFAYVDFDYYVSRGITFGQLLQLNVSQKIVTHDRETAGEYYSGKSGRQPQWNTYGDFKWKLDFDRIDEVLEYISKNPSAPDSMAKSQAIFRLLQENESSLEGKVYIDGSVPNIDPAYSEIITTLTQGRTRYYRYSDWNGKWLYTESGELVAAGDISKSELNKSLYGNPKAESSLYRILGFKKDATDKWEETIKDYDLLSEEKKQSFFELELQRRYGISDADLKAQYGTSSGTHGGSETIPVEPEPEFPTAQVKNWDSLKKHATEMFAFARPVQYEYLLRRIRTSNPNTSRTYLMGHYKAYGTYKYACQMCHKFYPNVDACQIEAHPKDELEPLYVLLCPNCTRTFQALRRNSYAYENFIDELQSITREEIEDEDTVKIEYGDQEIWFTQTHIAEISELLNLRETVEEENPTPIKPPSVPAPAVQPQKPVQPTTSPAKPTNTPTTSNTPSAQSGFDYAHCKGKRVRHKTMGTGVVTDCSSTIIKVKFSDGERAGKEVSFGIDACMKNNLFSLIK